MMKKYILPFLLILMSVVVSFSALSLSISEAKQRGLVGETLTGYLAVVAKDNAEVNALVNSINQAREQKVAGHKNKILSHSIILAKKSMCQ